MKYSIVQFNYVVGDFQYNSNKILDAIKNHSTSEWIVFSELCLSGYYPMDLINKPGFFDIQQEYIDLILKNTKNIDSKIVLGVITKNSQAGKRWFNSLIVIQNGEIKLNYNKQLLPTYDVFDERRHFEAGDNIQDNTMYSNDGTKIGFLICEDIWNDQSNDYSLNPVYEVARKNIDTLITINASPAIQSKPNVRFELVSSIAKKYNVNVLYCNQVGGQDALVFDGCSLIVDNKGELIQRARQYEEDIILLDTDIKHININPVYNGAEEYRKQLVLGIKDYFAKTGFTKAVIGSSGGIDSAVVLALATEALGSNNVIAITMPSKYSSDGSVSDSVDLCNKLGVKLLNIPIQNIVSSYQDTFTQSGLDNWSGIALENAQARSRGLILMGWANQWNALVLSTGNKSEMSVGYATLYGDMNGALNPLGDLYKMEVYELAGLYNKLGLLPSSIIEKPPSAELAPGQRDDQSLPPYPVLDLMLSELIDGDSLNIDQKNYLNTFDPDKKVYNEIVRKLHRAEFKRRQAPPIIKVHKKSFGFGWQYPLTQRFIK